MRPSQGVLLAITSPSCYHLGPQLPWVQLRSMGVHNFPFPAPKWWQILAFPWNQRASGPMGLNGDSTAPSQGAFLKGAGGCVITMIGTFWHWVYSCALVVNHPVRVLTHGAVNRGGHATQSSILAWEIPRTEEPGGLQSVGSQRVWHNWSDLACTGM